MKIESRLIITQELSQGWRTVPAPELTVTEIGQLHPHNSIQYREFSRLLAKKRDYRPVYIGYAQTPSDVLGVCH